MHGRTVASPRAMIATTYAASPAYLLYQSHITSEKLNVLGRLEEKEVGKEKRRRGRERIGILGQKRKEINEKYQK